MRLHRLIIASLIAALAATLSGCFLTKVLPEPKKKKRTPPGPAEAPPPTPIIPEPPALTPARLVRRLALDLTRKLPPAADVEALVEDPKLFPKLVDNYLAAPDAHIAVTGMHRRVWRLKATLLPDLERFAAAGDPTLGDALTDTMRHKLTEEPLLRLRYVLEQGKPFSALFTGAWTILPQDVLALYGLTDDGAPWQAEAFRFANYDDGRPAAGILVSNGLLATSDSQTAALPRHRTSELVRRFTCASPFQSTAHTFYSLSEEELRSDLAALAAVKSPCRGCHAQWDDVARALAGLGSGADFATWRAYQGDASVAGFWSGRAFPDATALGAILGEDPRVHRCEVERLIVALMQRPLTVSDTRLVATSIDDFYDDSGRLMAALPSLLKSKDYRFGPVPPDAAPEYQRTVSGVRFLRREHWQGIARQLTYGGDSLAMPDSLDAGADETATSDEGIPSGAYWYSVDRLARQLASLIVDEELADDRAASTRRLLTLLPDGSGYEADGDAINQQIVAAWRMLSSEEIVDTSAKPFSDFADLWNAMEPDGTEESFRMAWRAMLVAMLSHPTFLTY